MLPRVRPFPGPELELARAMLPPGHPRRLRDRPRAGDHVRRRAAARSLAGRHPDARRGRAGEPPPSSPLECDADAVIRDRIGDVPVTLVQTRLGIAASLILVPECLERLLGPGPHLLLAPMRDILIALPPDVDREFAAWLADEWEALDPNHLHLGGFRYGRGTVVPESIEEALARA